MSVVLQAKNLRRSFASLEVLKDVSFKLEAGQVVRLRGNNGSGKSTLLQLLRGNLRPDGGQLRLEEHDITRWSALRRARAGLCSGYQQPAFPGDLTAAAFLEQFGITEYLELKAFADTELRKLSFGEQKSVDNLRALHGDSRVVLLDEPTAGLAPELVGLVQSRVAQALKRGASVLWVAHCEAALGELPHKTLVLRGGHLREAGQ